MAENSEIIAGLKNAVERGSTLEQAKQSFLNAGYSEQDVEDSARSLGGVISEMPEVAKAKPSAELAVPKPGEKILITDAFGSCRF